MKANHAAISALGVKQVALLDILADPKLETCTADEIREVAEQRVRELITECKDAFCAVQESIKEDTSPIKWKDAASAPSSVAARMAAFEVSNVRANLDTLAGLRSSADVLTALCSSVDRLFRCSIVVGHHLQRRYDIPADEKITAMLAKTLRGSLEVRRAYRKFARRIAMEHPPSEEEIESRLRVAAIEIASLNGLDVYKSIRVRDRALFRSLQQRVIDWFRVPERDPKAGSRVWQDVSTFSSLLKLVSDRSQLVTHDFLILTRLVEALTDGPSVSSGDSRLISMPWLWGCDARLDALIEDPESADTEHWIAAATTVLRGLHADSEQGYTEEVTPEVLIALEQLHKELPTRTRGLPFLDLHFQAGSAE